MRILGAIFFVAVWVISAFATYLMLAGIREGEYVAGAAIITFGPVMLLGWVGLGIMCMTANGATSADARAIHDAIVRQTAVLEALARAQGVTVALVPAAPEAPTHRVPADVQALADQAAAAAQRIGS